MKITLTLLLCLLSFNLYSQDWDDDYREHHREKENKRDYYTLGIYSGNYLGLVPLKSANAWLNNITVEAEYFKFKDLSVVARVTYQFTKLELYDLKGYNEGPYAKLNEPATHRFNLSLMGRYYLGGRKLKPYVQLGINHETNYIGNYSINYYNEGSVYIDSYDKYFIHRYTINLGAGLTIKLSRKFSLDMKYDIYKSLGRNNGNNDFYGPNSNTKSGFNGYSTLIGIKYNLQ